MQPYLDQLSEILKQAMAGMTDEQLLRAPEGKWCAADVLEHLRLTYTGTAKMLERNRELAVIEAAPIDDRARAGRALIFEQNAFFEGLQAPPFATPKNPPDATVRAQVLEELGRMRDALDVAEQRRGRANIVGNHFALGPLTSEQWRHFHYQHGCHHARQIEALKAFAVNA